MLTAPFGSQSHVQTNSAACFDRMSHLPERNGEGWLGYRASIVGCRGWGTRTSGVAPEKRRNRAKFPSISYPI